MNAGGHRVRAACTSAPRESTSDANDSAESADALLLFALLRCPDGGLRAFGFPARLDVDATARRAPPLPPPRQLRVLIRAASVPVAAAEPDRTADDAVVVAVVTFFLLDAAALGVLPVGGSGSSPSSSSQHGGAERRGGFEALVGRGVDIRTVPPDCTGPWLGPGRQTVLQTGGASAAGGYVRKSLQDITFPISS